MSYFNQVSYSDTGNIDAFGRLRVSQPVSIFDGQFTYDLQPILYEQITNGSGASIAYDSTNRNALLTFSSTPTGGSSYMQTFECFRYQPGKSQQITITFNFIAAVSNVLKFAGYSDGVNGIEFQNTGAVNQFIVYSGTTNGNETAAQSVWNIDKLDGTGPSGLTLDITKAQILIMDFQALYTGRVRVGFNINGTNIFCHQFTHANMVVHPFLQSANLPVRCGMTCTGTVSTTMKFQCSQVASEGGSENTHGFQFTQAGSVTAGSGTRTHILSIRPKTTFNSIPYRSQIGFIDINGLVTGSNSVHWELCLGQSISGTTTFNDVNTTYSGMQYNTAGTISGSPTIVIADGYIAASGGGGGSPGAETVSLTSRYPLTLDHTGAVRSLGTLSLLVTGVGGTSACQFSVTWQELR